MSSNQPRRGRGQERSHRGRGRGREADDEECAPYLKKVRPATLGDALPKSASSPPSSERQPARPEQPTREAMPTNQPGRGWGGGRGRGRGREGDVDEGAPDSKKGRQATLPEHAWPALSSSSSSSEPTPTRSQVRPSSQANADTANSRQVRLPEVKERTVNRSSPFSSAGSTPRSQAQRGVVTPNSQLSPRNTPSPSSSGGSTLRYTPPREQVITRQSTPSSGSSGKPPSNRSMNSAESSGKKLSYIGVLEKGSDPDKHKRLSSKLALFLNDFTADGEACPYYQAELYAIKRRSPFYLTIHFRHMIKHDIELAFETWKSQGNMQDWLLPAVQNFLKLQKYASDEEIMSKTCLALSGFPSSIRKVTDVLNSATYSLELLGGESLVCEAKADGKLVVQLFFIAAFASHAKDLSWDGNFSVEDMYLVNNTELQICRPCVPATGRSRLRDLQTGGGQLLPFFKGPAGYPVYFSQLEEDLQQASISEIMEPWCAEYFCFHMASLPSMTRRNFELALHFVSKNIATELEDIFDMLVSELVTDWQEYIENSGCKPLIDVLHYIDPATGNTVKYQNTIGGLVKYKRNFLEHVLFGHLIDVNEIELFGAKKFSKHLPGAVKLLLQRKKMVKCFGAAWSSLKSSRFDGRDTPAKQ